jgi:hypothetical protein
MKILFWFGVAVAFLGLMSFVVPIPHNQREGFSAGNMSMSVQTQYSEKVAPLVSCMLLLGGAAMMFGGRSAVSKATA